MSAPKSASTSTIGPSHHFLRTRMKSHSSPTSETMPERATRPTPPQAYLRLIMPVKHWKNRVFLGSSCVAAGASRMAGQPRAKLTSEGTGDDRVRGSAEVDPADHEIAVAVELVDHVDEADVRMRRGPGAQVGHELRVRPPLPRSEAAASLPAWAIAIRAEALRTSSRK